jgi:cob(I)alamin adenosyltransferase
MKKRLNTIVTKTGDGGETALGGGQRVGKEDVRIEAYGQVDELNSWIGALRQIENLNVRIEVLLENIQQDLFDLGGELCFREEDITKYKIRRFSRHQVDRLESEAKVFNEDLEALEEFILPSGPYGVAQFHLARTVCRRVERWICRLHHKENLNPEILRYLNRLSDLLFILARWILWEKGGEEVLWCRKEKSDDS